MRMLDLSSWQGILTTVLALALITLVGVGIRLLVMLTIQARQQRENRQINERLRTLIAAYKTLGGSFTGDLAVDPTHLRDLRQRQAAGVEGAAVQREAGAGGSAEDTGLGSDRSRRIRDAVEGALSDILLLGTDVQVRLAAQAAGDLVAGRKVHTGALVASLRDFIREVLDLDPVPPGVVIPQQGPTRSVAAGRSAGRNGGERGEGGGRGGGAVGGGGAAAGGAAVGLGGMAGGAGGESA